MTTTFDTFLLAGPPPGARRTRAITYAFALALHGALLAVAIVQGAGRVDEVAPDRKIIVAPMRLPAPGAPAAEAPAKPKATPPRPKIARQRQAIVQPSKEIPRETVKQSEATDVPISSDETDPGTGGRGGCKGCTGTEGTSGHFVAPNVASGQLAIDPHADPHRVRLPPALTRSGLQLWALVRVCVSRDGTVDDVRFLKSADPIVDPLVVQALRTWRYRPYQVNGRPVPFCTNVRYVMATQ
jgi:periplasmic protein TonB